MHVYVHRSAVTLKPPRFPIPFVPPGQFCPPTLWGRAVVAADSFGSVGYGVGPLWTELVCLVHPSVSLNMDLGDFGCWPAWCVVGCSILRFLGHFYHDQNNCFLSMLH